MAISAIASTASYAVNPQQVPSIGQHKHGKHHAQSISDVDGQGSSIGTSASSTGKIGSKVDITA